MFKRFLSQVLTASKKQVAQDCEVVSIKSGLCWMSCRGEVRSLSFDVLGPVLPLDAQRKKNAIGSLELGKQYIDFRASLCASGIPDMLRTVDYAETLSKAGMDECIRQVQDDKSVRLKDILKYVRVVKISDYNVKVHGIWRSVLSRHSID